jgi:RimJ/RimL family protein N-acetyltransferase
LTDEVVRLRPPTEADAGWIAEAVRDPEIPRWTRVPSPYTKDDAVRWIALADRMRREGSALHLLIADAHDDAPLGSVALEIHSRPSRHGQIGYWVAAPARGQGAATRAVKLLAGWALDELRLPAIEIEVMPGNRQSRAVARKAGFTLVERRLALFRTTIEEFEVYVLTNGGGRP